MTERGVLNRDEIQIRNQLQKLSDMVQTAIDDVCDALRNLNTSKCETIIANNQIIQNQHRRIEQDCFATIATQQPVAVDLRVLAAALRISIELERIADYVAGIANTITEIASHKPIDDRNEILALIMECKEMLQQSVRAYLSNNPDMALTVAQKEFEIDKRQLQISDNIIAQMLNNSALVPFGSRLLWIVHSMERIGDRATDICEQTIYIHNGKLPNLHQ